MKNLANLLPDHNLLMGGAKALLAHCDRIEGGMPGVELAASGMKGRKLVLFLGPLFEMLSAEARADVLEHEAWHVALAHIQRKGDRIPDLWNRVCDASIHNSQTGVAWQRVDAELVAQGKPFGAVTFERLQLEPMSPELAYEQLRGRMQEIPLGHGCGSLLVDCGDGEVPPELVSAALEIGAALGVYKGAGSNRGVSQLIGELPAPPPWIRKVLQYTIAALGRGDRRRSWLRENNRSIMLPGYARASAKQAHFLIDASGSCWEDIPKFLAAVLSTPELRESWVTIFDAEASDPVRVNEVLAVMGKGWGGGTAIRLAGEKRMPGMPAIWLTDGESGDGWPSERPGETDVWCLTTKQQPPFGEILRVEV